MRKSLVVLALAFLTPAPAAVAQQAAQQAEVMTIVRTFVDGFNTGDVASALTACAEQTSIIDEFPPHEWHGPGACAKWVADYDLDAKKKGLTDGIVTLATPKHLNVSGDRAYVVIPSSYDYKLNGKPVKQTGATFTFALHKGPTGWKISGWSWSTG